MYLACLDYYAQDWAVYVALGLAVALVVTVVALWRALRALSRARQRAVYARRPGEDWPRWKWPTDEPAR